MATHESARGKKPSPTTSGAEGTGARHMPTYLDTQAEYIAVRKNDLEEIGEFGWLQEGAGAAGMFFFSGAFWLAANILVEHFGALDKYVGGFAFCAISTLFGIVLLWIAKKHFSMRDARIQDYFRKKGGNNDIAP